MILALIASSFADEQGDLIPQLILAFMQIGVIVVAIWMAVVVA